MCVYISVSVIYSTAQDSSDNLPSCPLNNHHCSDVVYCRGEGILPLKRLNTNINTQCLFGNKNVPVHTSNTSTEAACLMVIFTAA